MQKITPFLWFDNNAEEAVNFYTTVFKDAKTVRFVRYTEAGPGPAGSVMLGEFELFGQRFIALNGGPVFKFTEAVSFAINCGSQDEIDYYWDKLTDGGTPSQCGWLKDRFGLSWQVVPDMLGRLMESGDNEARKRVMQAVFKMKKLDIAEMERAFNAKG